MVRQSERRDLYEDALARLVEADLTYPCYCTRREVREATRAPHGDLPEGAYPGTCRHLTAAERAGREADGRPPALRLRAEGARASARSTPWPARSRAPVDDVVLRRNDGLPAYNLVVVVDDAAQGVEEVVRGDDLLPSTPRQVHLAHLLGLAPPRYLHVPLVVGPDGQRLAKRHGAVTLADLADAGRRARPRSATGCSPPSTCPRPAGRGPGGRPGTPSTGRDLPRSPWSPTTSWDPTADPDRVLPHRERRSPRRTGGLRRARRGPGPDDGRWRRPRPDQDGPTRGAGRRGRPDQGRVGLLGATARGRRAYPRPR